MILLGQYQGVSADLLVGCTDKRWQPPDTNLKTVFSSGSCGGRNIFNILPAEGQRERDGARKSAVD